MPHSRFYKLEIEKKNLIIRTALTEFSSKDFDQASINQISKKAGLSAGNLYYYFENKEDLYMTVVEFVMNELSMELGDFSSALHEGPFWENIKFWVLKRLKLSLRDKEVGYFINKLFEYNTSKEINAIELKFKENIRNQFREIFNLGVEKGAIRSDLPLDFLYTMHLNLVLTTNQWIAANWDQFESDDIESKEVKEFVDTAIELIQSAMQPAIQAVE